MSGESLSIVSALRLQSNLSGDAGVEPKSPQGAATQQRILREFMASLSSTLVLSPDDCRDLAMTAAYHLRGAPDAGDVVKSLQEKAGTLFRLSGHDQDVIASRIEAVQDGARRGLEGELPEISPESLTASIISNRQADRERVRSMDLSPAKEVSVSITH